MYVPLVAPIGTALVWRKAGSPRKNDLPQLFAALDHRLWPFIEFSEFIENGGGLRLYSHRALSARPRAPNTHVPVDPQIGMALGVGSRRNKELPQLFVACDQRIAAFDHRFCDAFPDHGGEKVPDEGW